VKHSGYNSGEFTPFGLKLWNMGYVLFDNNIQSTTWDIFRLYVKQNASADCLPASAPLNISQQVLRNQTITIASNISTMSSEGP